MSGRLNSKHTFPYVYSYNTGEETTLETIIRIKDDRDGRWWRTAVKRTTRNVDLAEAIRMVMAEAYRAILFGVVPTHPEKQLNQMGLPCWELDNIQYSEHGKMYVDNDMMFPKAAGAPKVTGRHPLWEEELVQIWNDKYKKFYE